MNPGHSRKLEQAVLQISRILNTLDDSITMLQEGTVQKNIRIREEEGNEDEDTFGIRGNGFNERTLKGFRGNESEMCG